VKRIIIIAALVALVTVIAYIQHEPDKEDKPLVAAVFPVTVDAFVQFQNEAQKVLSKNGVNFISFSAEGDSTRFHSILDLAVKKNPDALVIVGTQLTNIGLGTRYSNYVKPIIASCISDPSKVDALVKIGIEPPRQRNVSIITDMPKIDAYRQSVIAIQAAIPGIKQVGILFNESEINSKNTANKLATPLREAGVSVIEGVISSEGDVVRVASTLIRNGAELLVIPHDKYVIKQAAALSKMGREAERKVPVFALDDGTVRKDGAAFGVSVDYGLIGALTAQQVLDIMNGKIKASSQAIMQQEKAAVVINKSIWSALGLPALESDSIKSLNPTIIE